MMISSSVAVPDESAVVATDYGGKIRASGGKRASQ
jgi:hypothetical protein